MAASKKNKENNIELTEKQEAYCQAYVISGRQSASYRIAYDAEAMNQNTVSVEACKLHSNPNITIRIKELQKQAYERNKVTVDEIIQSLAGMVRFDIADLYDEDGKLLPLRLMPLEARQMISQLDTEELFEYEDGDRVLKGYSKKIRTINKLDAIEKLMKHLGGYEKDNHQRKMESNPTITVEIVKPKDE